MHGSAVAPRHEGHGIVLDDLLGQIDVEGIDGDQGGSGLRTGLVPRRPTTGLTRFEQARSWIRRRYSSASKSSLITFTLRTSPLLTGTGQGPP